jgi:hypothetical protein
MKRENGANVKIPANDETNAIGKSSLSGEVQKKWGRAKDEEKR